jgi:hypothetical protein
MPHATPFERYVAPAREKPQLWRFVVGLVVVFAVYLGLALAQFIAVGFFVDFGGTRAGAVRWLLSTPTGVLFLLSTFLGMTLGVWAAAAWVHGRGFSTLTGRGAQVVRDFLVAAGIVLALALPITGISLLFSPVEPGLPFGEWLALLPLTLIGLALQTLSEELLFRGYILQQMAARFRSRFAWMVLPSLVFGSLHYDASMPPAAGIMAVATIALFGIAAADLTARTGSLGASWGFHFANNVTALAVVSVGDTITGLSLGRTTVSAHGAGLSPALYLGDVGLILLAWFLCRKALSR